MNPHVSEWLAAYHDGELPASRQHQVEKHLQDCPTCRAELEALKELSSFLKADIVPAQTPPERFAAQVQLRLPRASLSRADQRAGKPPRWVLGIPLVLITVWAFLQAALKLATFILTADQIFGVVGGRAALLKSWITTEGFVETSANLLLLNGLLLIGTIILWSAWMALWLAWNKNQTETSIKGGVT
jgi:anti-sigma factor RsiW